MAGYPGALPLLRAGDVPDPEARLDAPNQGLLARLHEGGVAAPSYTTLGGRYCLRAAIVNHRTRDEDLTVLVEEVLRLGRSLVQAGR